jgi:hypothetical protein
LFNCIFDSGIIPESWLTGNVKPIYKNKGNHLDPKNFRPITILSCFGNLFTAVLLTRLNAFSEKFSILNENQSGFRKGYSTIDNIFVLYAFFELLKLKKKPDHLNTSRKGKGRDFPLVAHHYYNRKNLTLCYYIQF